MLKNEKNILIALAILFSANTLFAQPAPIQQSAIDSFKNTVNGKAPDTAKVHAFYWLSRAKTLSNMDESVGFANKGLDLARQIKFPIGSWNVWKHFPSLMLSRLHLKKALVLPMK